MFDSLKLIWLRIQKKTIMFIGNVCVGYLAQRYFDWYFFDERFFSWSNVISATTWGAVAVFLLFLFSFSYYGLLLIAEKNSQLLRLNSKRIVDVSQQAGYKPQSKEVQIGTFVDGMLSVDILADLIPNEVQRSDIEIFLQRVNIGRPYCTKCSRPLTEVHADWMADGVTVGFKCAKCNIEREGDSSDVHDDIIGEVRRNFSSYYEKYETTVQKHRSTKSRKPLRIQVRDNWVTRWRMRT